MFSRNFSIHSSTHLPWTLIIQRPFIFYGVGGGEGEGRRWDLKNMMTHYHHKIFWGWPSFVISQNNWDDPPPPTDWKWTVPHIKIGLEAIFSWSDHLWYRFGCINTGCKWTIIREPLWPPNWARYEAIYLCCIWEFMQFQLSLSHQQCIEGQKFYKVLQVLMKHSTVRCQGRKPSDHVIMTLYGKHFLSATYEKWCCRIDTVGLTAGNTQCTRSQNKSLTHII